MALIYTSTVTPMVVWRVQDDEGLGPYNGGRVDYPNAKCMQPACHPVYGNPRLARAPDPHDDFEESDLSIWNRDRWTGPFVIRFGFLNYRDAVAWFGKARLDLMETVGYYPTPRKAKKVWLSISGKQVMFVPWTNNPNR